MMHELFPINHLKYSFRSSLHVKLENVGSLLKHFFTYKHFLVTIKFEIISYYSLLKCFHSKH